MLNPNCLQCAKLCTETEAVKGVIDFHSVDETWSIAIRFCSLACARKWSAESLEDPDQRGQMLAFLDKAESSC